MDVLLFPLVCVPYYLILLKYSVEVTTDPHRHSAAPPRRPHHLTSDCPHLVISARIHKKKQGGSEYVTMRQRNRLSKPKMKQEFFTNLPSEIIIDILSRLPVRTIISCKCVCKPWLNLLETDEFAKSHLSKSVPGLAVKGPVLCKISEFVDVLDLERLELHDITVTEFDSPYYGLLEGLANGLLFMSVRTVPSKPDDLYIFNPITRDYIQIPRPQEFAYGNLFTYGFGAGRITGQHKVVRIFRGCTSHEETERLRSLSNECEVYTLGTGSWRSITHGLMFEYDPGSFGAFFNGHLHWLVFDLNGCPWISCFDLEDELFSIFPSPPVLPGEIRFRLGLFALEDCLCLSDWTSNDEIVIWLMDHGVEQSWMKEFVISKSQIPANNPIACPIKVFKDGLMAWGGSSVFFYSRKTTTTREINIFQSDYRVDLILHTSSFLSLKRFVKEKVISF